MNITVRLLLVPKDNPLHVLQSRLSNNYAEKNFDYFCMNSKPVHYIVRH